MKIRTDLPTSALAAAAHAVGVTFSRFTLSESRTHSYGVDVVLSGSGKRANCERDKGATWDEWGMFLAILFAADRRTTTPYYKNAEHFRWATGDRYAPYGTDLVLQGTECPDHKWTFAGETPTRAYMVYECAKGCGAIKRYGSKEYVRENF